MDTARTVNRATTAGGGWKNTSWKKKFNADQLDKIGWNEMIWVEQYFLNLFKPFLFNLTQCYLTAKKIKYPATQYFNLIFLRPLQAETWRFCLERFFQLNSTRYILELLLNVKI